MIDHARQVQLGEDLVRRFGAAVRAVQLYATGHPVATRATQSLTTAVQAIQSLEPVPVIIGLVVDELVVGDVPLKKASGSMAQLIRQLRAVGVDRITIEPDFLPEEVITFLRAFAEAAQGHRHSAGPQAQEALSHRLTQPHIRVGRVQAEDRAQTKTSDSGTVQGMYNEAVSTATVLWEAARTEGRLDPVAARQMVDGLAQAVTQNRTTLLALTALKEYDNYTFTHMVNVAILTMAQARALGVEGPLLREFGLAGLMHDIGKVRTPAEILSKPEQLTDAEFVVMKRHPIDGAEILRRTPELPTLPAVVAFEHHLRLDGSGYPDGVSRTSLNIGTQLCSIADVYDAMRSQRQYQDSFPTDRILAVLQKNDGVHFDQHLVRRFVQLVGIYPVGNLVLLSSGAAGIVIRAYPPDPFRPRVQVMFGTDRQLLDQPYDVDLWESQADSEAALRIVAPLDPREFGIDPLTKLSAAQERVRER